MQAKTNDAKKPDDIQPEPVMDVKKNAGGEIGGPQGPEPTRYGDWERRGRCIDF